MEYNAAVPAMEPWAKLASLETACSKEDFFSGLEVWLRRPHVVNRRLLGSVVLQEEAVERGREGELLRRWRGGTSRAAGGREDKESIDLTECMTDGSVADNGGMSRQVPNMEVAPPPTGYSLRCQVRELLPRMRSLLPGREAVITGEAHRLLWVVVPLTHCVGSSKYLHEFPPPPPPPPPPA